MRRERVESDVPACVESLITVLRVDARRIEQQIVPEIPLPPVDAHLAGHKKMVGVHEVSRVGRGRQGKRFARDGDVHRQMTERAADGTRQRHSNLATSTGHVSPREIEALGGGENSVAININEYEGSLAVRRLDQQRLDASSTRRGVEGEPTGESLCARWNPQVRWHCREPCADDSCLAVRADTW